jgi:hypothetical protein
LIVHYDDAGEIETKRFRLGADGATAPETLRHKNRVVRTIWRETPTLVECPPKGMSVVSLKLGRIKLSGTVTDGALTSDFSVLGDSNSREPE